MSLITGVALDLAKYFSGGSPVHRGSSVDLTIGKIFDREGRSIDGPFILKPGHIIQVVSAESFRLPDNVTALVTYKTTLTKLGIWALTVGIVDPGWQAPVTTTLLNFSKAEFPINPGMPFLRVMLFGHDSLELKHIAPTPQIDKYMSEARAFAMTKFDETFLNQKEVTKAAGDEVIGQLKNRVIVWVASIVAVFGLFQFLYTIGQAATNYVLYHGSMLQANDEFGRMRNKIDDLQARVIKLESVQNTTQMRLEGTVKPVGPAQGAGAFAKPAGQGVGGD